MSIFICSKCGCIDNTATSDYWALVKNNEKLKLIYSKDLSLYKGSPLCSECARIDYINNIWYVVPGKWHNKFDKKEATEKDKRNIGRNGIIQ